MICTDCFVEGSFLKPNEHGEDPHHVGFLSGNVQGRCSMNSSCVPCPNCGFGSCCSCRCHSDFVMHMRFSTADELREVVQRVTEYASDPIEHADATLIRLQYGGDPTNPVAYEKMCRLAARLDPVNCRNVPDYIRQAAMAEAAIMTTTTESATAQEASAAISENTTTTAPLGKSDGQAMRKEMVV
jgi:hypothetical protein